jgi:hypothetical protein
MKRKAPAEVEWVVSVVVFVIVGSSEKAAAVGLVAVSCWVRAEAVVTAVGG